MLVVVALVVVVVSEPTKLLTPTFDGRAIPVIGEASLWNAFGVVEVSGWD